MTDRLFDLEGRVALVTGAGQNVGTGIARALASQGATVLINDVVAERANAVAESIATAGGTARPLPFDVTDLDAVMAATASEEPIDVLVNNAGNGGSQPITVKPFVDMDPGEWAAPIAVNLYGVLHGCHAVVGDMCRRGWGRVITISSGAATGGVGIGVAPYSAGKGGALAFTRSLALEVASSGVTANSVAIGLMQPADSTMTDRLARAIPVGRTGTPRDVGAACVWLASDDASWVTGQTVQVNGGAITT